MGNQLWQYAAGRILSQKLGYRLKTQGISGLNDCPERIRGKRIYYPKIELHGHFIPEDLEQKRIILNGYFERYEYVQPYMEQIRYWFKSTGEYPGPEPDSLTVSIRRGSNNWPVATLCPSLDYYLEKIENLGFKKHYICTDSPKDEFITELASQIKNAEVIESGTLAQFSFLQHSRNILIAPSTFSWWAAMTGDAETIFWPEIPALNFKDTNQDWFPIDCDKLEII